LPANNIAKSTWQTGDQGIIVVNRQHLKNLIQKERRGEIFFTYDIGIEFPLSWEF
jgi:hypothetical protein